MVRIVPRGYTGNEGEWVHFQGSSSCQMIFASFLKWSTLNGKNLLPLGANSYLLEETSFNTLPQDSTCSWILWFDVGYQCVRPSVRCHTSLCIFVSGR